MTQWKLSMIACMLLVKLNAFHIDHINNVSSIDDKPETPLPVETFFTHAPARFKNFKIVTDPLNLQQIARDTLRYLDAYHTEHNFVIAPEKINNLMPYENVRNTLEFLVDTIEQDKATGIFQILDPVFIKHNFNSLHWNADWKYAHSQNVTMPEDGRIRLTTYCILTAPGSYKKTAQYPCGLYLLLDDSIQKKYTKQQILGGALEKQENRPKRKPLAWVSRQNLEDALMQGTIIVNFDDGSSKIFRVSCNNGIDYDRKIKNVLIQKRYWFFHEFTLPEGASETVKRFKARKDVVFAGDLWHLGIGKVFALTYENPLTKEKEMRIGILADTGGAFKNNLYQLDLFGGIFDDRNSLRNHIQSLPSAATACILSKKIDIADNEEN